MYHFSQKVKGVGVGVNQTQTFSFKKRENGKIQKLKTNKQSKRKQHPPFYQFLDTMYVRGNRVFLQNIYLSTRKWETTSYFQHSTPAKWNWKHAINGYLTLKWAHKTHIRQNCWQIKKHKKNYGWFVRIFECYSFDSILGYRKMGKFLLQCILFPQNMILNFIRKLTNLTLFLRIKFSLGLLSGEFDIYFRYII